MEFSNIDNIEIVVSILKQNNIKNLVISPGGTNIPIIKKVQDDDFFNCFSIVDERSAAYTAIGIYLQTNFPVAIICTSAQATRNYIPGLTEAFYKRVPILAITMEKHPRFKYQEYMQEPDQTSLPIDSVKKSFELPYISDINDFYYSIRLANEAILELSRGCLGPVQLCIPWLDFELQMIKPNVKSIFRYQADEIKSENLSYKKILLLIGEHTPFTDEEKESINNFCNKTNCVVYVNHLSNFSNEYSVEANLVLLTARREEIKMIKPDILISIGGQTGDYPFYLAFSDNSLDDIEHWRISDDGIVVDTYDKLTRLYVGDIKNFFNNINSVCDEHTFWKKWNSKYLEMETELEFPFSNLSIAQYLHDKIPHKSIIQFSILNSLRMWNFFHIDSSVECYSNVGAFGIDGGLSTLIGQSLMTEKLAFMIIGDLAFLYDMNCLSIRDIKNNVRILVINNNGGVEFKLNGEDKRETDKFIAAADYHGEIRGWAQSCGFDYYSAYNMNEFIECVPSFISYSNKPIVLECFVSDYDEREAYRQILNFNKSKNIEEKTKELIKKFVGDKSINKIKNIING